MASAIEHSVGRKIVVHIGLPKTATTSLQTWVFPLFPKERVKYLGVCQPREGGGESALYDALIRYVMSGGNLCSTRQLLIANLSEEQTLLLSEEMIVVGVEWKKQLERLGNLLDGLNYQIVVTVREPVAAMFSYYCEMHRYFLSEKVCFVDAVINDEHMKIYYYEVLIGILERHFDLKRVAFFSFEKIIHGDLDEIVRIVHGGDWTLPTLPNENSKTKTSDHVFVTHSLLEKIMSIMCFIPIMDICIRKLNGISIFNKAARRLSRIQVKKSKVAKPSGSELSYLQDVLSEGVERLYAVSGIKYYEK